MRQDDDTMTGWGALALFILLLACAGIDLAWNHYVYDDASCAWSHCVRVK